MGNETPTNDAPVTVEPVADLIEMLRASTQEDGCRVFDHSAEEIGLHVMENTQAILAALASAPAGVKITVRQKTPVVADYGDNFLVAQVSADGKTVGIDHPCDAVWADVDRAQTALRDYINERIAGQDKCPFKPRDAASAPAGDGERTPFPDGPCPICHGRWYHASECPNAAWNAALARARAAVGERAFQMGDRVEKISGSSWRGRVVGTYSTALTPEGYAVESDTEVGSVQIYPAKALRLARPRAAVGERNHLIEIVTEAIHDHAADNAGTARDHATHAVTRILALQSPPAKVEG